MNTEQFDGHTPGPWAFYTMGADEPYHAVHADGWETWGIQTPITNGADARLIAAAPDLLAEVKRLRQAFLIATGHVGYGNHLGHNELRHALNSVGIDVDSLPWAGGEWSEEE